MTVTNVVNGILLGGFYALVALGLSLVFGVLKLINLAHGELMVGGAYLSLLLTRHLGLGAIASIPIVVVLVGVIGYLVQRFLLTGLLLRTAQSALVATFGISLIAQAIFNQGFSANTQSLQASFATGGIQVAGVRVRTAYVIAFIVAALLCTVTHLVLTRTRAGAVVRAVAADSSTAGLMGYNIERVYALTFAVAAAITSVSGVLLGITFSFTPTTGTSYLLVGIAVVVIGGVGNVAGTFVAGLALGLVQSVAVGQFGGGYRDLVVYLVFFVVLVIRPSGLFGKRIMA